MQWIEHEDDDQQEPAAKRPRFNHGPATHKYWHRAIVDAKKRLQITERAETARKNSQYATYELRDRNQSVNAISRKLVAKANNIVTDNPEVTPQFREQDDELNWADKIQAFAKNAIRKGRLKHELRRILWDNFCGDIGWGKVDFVTRFALPAPVSPLTQKREALAERGLIETEFEQLLAGEVPLVGPDDLHGLHIEAHEQQLEELDELIRGRQVPKELADILDLHQADHREADEHVEDEKVEFLRWPAYLVYYDPGALRWEDVEWYAFEMVARREELVADPQLHNVIALKGQPGLCDDPYHERRAGSDGVELNKGAPEEAFIRYFVTTRSMTSS